MRVKCLAQEHNTMTRPGLEPGPLDPESSTLTTRPPIKTFVKINGRRSDIMVSALGFGSRGSSLGRIIVSVFLGKTLYSQSARLSPPRSVNGY